MSRSPLRVPLSPIAAGLCALPPDAAAYVARVHRLRAGDPLVVFDPEAAIEAEATVSEAGRRGVEVRVGAPRPALLRPARRVTWIQAIGKGDKMDAVVRDATELGATAVLPVMSARCAGWPAPEKSARWRRVAVEAARQCGRGDAPRVGEPVLLDEAIRGVADSAARMCLDPGAMDGLGARLLRMPGGAEAAFVAGPEGGLTGDELAACEAAGFLRVRLGALTLRTETVCAAVLGALLALGEAGEVGA